MPAGATLKVEHWSTSRPGIVPPDSEAIQLGLDAFEEVLGVRPALIRSGGTLPIVAALTDKDIPTIISGFSLPERPTSNAPQRAAAHRVRAPGHRDRQGAVRPPGQAVDLVGAGPRRAGGTGWRPAAGGRRAAGNFTHPPSLAGGLGGKPTWSAGNFARCRPSPGGLRSYSRTAPHRTGGASQPQVSSSRSCSSIWISQPSGSHRPPPGWCRTVTPGTNVVPSAAPAEMEACP